MKKYLTIFLFSLAIFSVFAQSETGNTAWMEYLEELSETETDPDALENLYGDLSYLSEHPLDLYRVTQEDLRRLPFLTEFQIENLLYYIYKYSPLASIYELKNVEGLDRQTIALILPFVYLGDPESEKTALTPTNVIKMSKQEILIRSDYCFQEKAGYKKVSEEEKHTNPNKYYVGERYYCSLKYGFNYKDKIQLGLVSEKDPGERFWNRDYGGPDYYSAHLVLKNMGILETLILGDYRLSFGQGLVLNTDFSMGKTSDVINVNKKNSGIKRHYSTGESGFFRGGSVVLKKRSMEYSLFYSHTSPDAKADSSIIYSFKTDGYNRTSNDLEKKKQSELDLFGTHIQWKNDMLNIGMTGCYYHFGGKSLEPEEKPYNVFYLRGKENLNAGIDYRIIYGEYFFQGETAISGNGKIATCNTFQYSPASFIGLVCSYRNYGKAYQAPFARSFSESSTVQNESGFYWGLRLKFLKYWDLSSYVDVFKFPWLKYGVSSPSEGTDALLQLSYRPVDRISMNWRYKYKQKAKDQAGSVPEKQIYSYEQHRLRYWIDFRSNSGLSMRSQFDVNLYFPGKESENYGWAFSQSVGYNSEKFPLKADAGFSYFHTKDWTSRIGLYEKGLPYAYGFSSFYGDGIRYYMLARMNLSGNISIYAKIANTGYFDRTSIGSALEEISGNNKTDLYFMVKIRF